MKFRSAQTIYLYDARVHSSMTTKLSLALWSIQMVKPTNVGKSLAPKQIENILESHFHNLSSGHSANSHFTLKARGEWPGEVQINLAEQWPAYRDGPTFL